MIAEYERKNSRMKQFRLEGMKKYDISKIVK